MNNKRNNNMKTEATFDLGPTLVDVSAEKATNNDRILFTFYVGGASLRSHNLHLPAVRDRMLDGMWLLAGAPPARDVTKRVRDWIDSKVDALS